MLSLSASETPATTAAQRTLTSAAPREASPTDVQKWLQAGECLLIDVREPDEHARERIAGSALLPLSRFDPQRVAAMARPGQKVVLHCRGGKRSADACRLAAQLADGGLVVLSMAGGIEAWKQQSLAVQVNSSAPGISVMRQVQLVIGVCVLTGCGLAWFLDPRFVAIPAFFGAGLTFAGASGTCALATLVGWLPWNRAAAVGAPGASCTTGSCG